MERQSIWLLSEREQIEANEHDWRNSEVLGAADGRGSRMADMEVSLEKKEYERQRSDKTTRLSMCFAWLRSN